MNHLALLFDMAKKHVFLQEYSEGQDKPSYDQYNAGKNSLHTKVMQELSDNGLAHAETLSNGATVYRLDEEKRLQLSE